MKNLVVRIINGKVLLVLLLVVSVAFNLLLSRKIERLNRALIAAESLQSLTAGTSVPPLEVKDQSGAGVTFSYSDDAKPTIIYIFTPQCMWCTRNLENIKLLSRSVTKDYRVIGISLTTEDLTEYLSNNQFNFPVYVEPSTATKTNYKLGATPKTIVVSTDGKVLKTWSGAFMGDLQTEIEDFFRLDLPGLKNEFASKK